MSYVMVLELQLVEHSKHTKVFFHIILIRLRDSIL